MSATPSKGKSASGNRAVADMGMASVIHQTAMSKPTAATRQAASGIPSGAGRKKRTAQQTSPAPKPAHCLKRKANVVHEKPVPLSARAISRIR